MAQRPKGLRGLPSSLPDIFFHRPRTELVTMTKIQKHTIDLHTPKTDALETAQSELEHLTDQTARLSSLALAGNLGADTLADHNDRINLATLRLEAARTAAEDELGEVADANSIADAIAELLQDDTVATTAIERSIENLREAISAVHHANQDRNAAIVGWVGRLRALGIPDAGLTVNDDEIRILSQGVTGTTIAVGAGRVATVPSVAGHIRHVVGKDAADAHMAIDPSNLPSADTRGRAQAAIATVRLTRPLGGRAVGDILTTRTHTLGVLAQMVHSGNAELIEGEVPEPSTRERSFMPVDSRPKGPADVATPRNVHDDATVEAAVTKAFAI